MTNIEIMANTEYILCTLASSLINHYNFTKMIILRDNISAYLEFKSDHIVTITSLNDIPKGAAVYICESYI